MRRLLALGAVAAAVTFSAVPAAAEPIARFPLCDLEGRCDKWCEVNAKPPILVCR